jgi:hypothetical protein
MLHSKTTPAPAGVVFADAEAAFSRQLSAFSILTFYSSFRQEMDGFCAGSMGRWQSVDNPDQWFDCTLPWTPSPCFFGENPRDYSIPLIGEAGEWLIAESCKL